MAGTADVTVVSLGSTPGLRRADDAFAEQLRAAGRSCEIRRAVMGRQRLPRRTLAVVDLGQALAARRAARGVDGGFVVYSAVTSALLQPRRGPYAVRFDAPAALNRPGPTGAWQRRAERRALGGARVLLPWSEAASAAAPGDVPRVVVPVPVPELGHDGERDIDAIAYAGDPAKRGLDVLCRAWTAAGAGARLVVGGIEREAALQWLDRRGVPEPAGVEWRGALAREDWLAAVRRARLFVNASRWEDYGISQLEALSAGAALVTVPSPGPYEALRLARRLAPKLVDPDLAPALAAALALGPGELAAYRNHAAAGLARYRPAAVQALVEAEVVPLLDGR